MQIPKTTFSFLTGLVYSYLKLFWTPQIKPGSYKQIV